MEIKSWYEGNVAFYINYVYCWPDFQPVRAFARNSHILSHSQPNEIILWADKCWNMMNERDNRNKNNWQISVAIIFSNLCVEG